MVERSEEAGTKHSVQRREGGDEVRPKQGVGDLFLCDGGCASAGGSSTRDPQHRPQLQEKGPLSPRSFIRKPIMPLIAPV